MGTRCGECQSAWNEVAEGESVAREDTAGRLVSAPRPSGWVGHRRGSAPGRASDRAMTEQSAVVVVDCALRITGHGDAQRRGCTPQQREVGGRGEPFVLFGVQVVAFLVVGPPGARAVEDAISRLPSCSGS